VIAALGSDTVQIAEGLDAHGCARKLDGSVWCWGDNLHGEVGDGAIDGPKCFEGWPCQATPLAVGGIGGTTQDVAVGLGFTVAVRGDFTTFFWGDGTWGVRGDGTLGGDAPAPVAVTALGSSVAQVSAGHEHVCARKVDGTVWCWGRNEGGQLGDGTTDGVPCLGWKCRPSPVQVAGLDLVVKIAAGGFHTCAIRVGPTLWCWGDNSGGQLGVGPSPVTAATPVQVPLPGGVTEVAAGHLHTCARLGDGTLWCWGYNGSGQVGDGTTDNRFIPVQIDTAGKSVTHVSTGDSHTCARTVDGTLLCWGERLYWEAGDGAGSAARLTPGPVALPCP
jgi:alpha-tubulin suppressor-like RCC1 family protein